MLHASSQLSVFLQLPYSRIVPFLEKIQVMSTDKSPWQAYFLIINSVTLTCLVPLLVFLSKSAQLASPYIFSNLNFTS